jgi:hypothetical protein
MPSYRPHAVARIMLTQAAACRYTGHTLAKFFVTLTTGLVTGLTAAACAATLEFVFARKQQAVQYMIDVVHHKTLYAAFGLHLLITTGLLMFAACLVRVARSCHLTPASVTHACTIQTWLPVNLANAPDACTTFGIMPLPQLHAYTSQTSAHQSSHRLLHVHGFLKLTSSLPISHWRWHNRYSAART